MLTHIQYQAHYRKSPASISRMLSSTLSHPFFLLGCQLLIGLVSAYDIFLTIKYVEYLPELELNPIGRWLMQLDAGPTCSLDQVACFVSAKFAGNFLSLAIIEALGRWKPTLAGSVAVVVAALQLVLLSFLIAA